MNELTIEYSVFSCLKQTQPSCCFFLKKNDIYIALRNNNNKEMKFKYKVVILLLLGVITNQQTITFQHRNETLQNTCKFGGEDIIYIGAINISKKLEYLEDSNYEIKSSNSDFHAICFLDLYKCNGYTLSNCYCMSTDDNDVFDVVINITGQVSNSEALLRGKLMFFDQHIYSEVITLPKIYDVPKVKPSLVINDNAINLDLCDESINGNDVNFVFFLDQSDGIPSRLEITDHLNRTLKDTHLSTLSYSTKVYGNQTYILSVEFCGSQKYRQSFVCNIIPERSDTDVHLFINGGAVNISKCEETLNNSDVSFLFFVSDSVYSVKQLVMVDNSTNETVTSNSLTLTHTTRIYDIRTFFFQYELDGLAKKEESFCCNIQVGKEKSTYSYFDVCEVLNQNEKFFITAMIFISITVVSLFTNAFLIFQYNVLKRFKKCSVNLIHTRKKPYDVEVEKPFVRESVECKLENKDNDNDQEENTNSIQVSNSDVKLAIESSNNVPQALKHLLNIDIKT